MRICNVFVGFPHPLLAHSGVDPLVSGLIYFISIPLFIVSTALWLRNIHIGKPAAAPAALSVVFLLGSYIYLSSVNTVLPVWAYLVAAIVVAILASFALLIYRNEGSSNRRRLSRH
jgi:O-antigen/teichoic acid export membrane protein